MKACSQAFQTTPFRLRFDHNYLSGPLFTEIVKVSRELNGKDGLLEHGGLNSSVCLAITGPSHLTTVLKSTFSFCVSLFVCSCVCVSRPLSFVSYDEHLHMPVSLF